MSEVPFPEPHRPVLDDPWAAPSRVPLDGALERQQFPPMLMALGMMVAAFVLFQFVISPIAIVVLLLLQGVAPGDLLAALSTLVTEQGFTLIVANTVGQVLGLAVPTLLVARLHSTRPGAFLRLRRSDGATIGLAVLGLVAFTPVVQWLANVNQGIPLPEPLRAFEQAQLDLLEKVLMQDLNVGLNLLMLAVTPALCEELLFRGYLQRQAERGLGLFYGLLFSGLAFGLYHLRLSQALPLSALGLYMAYLAWRTGSLWPPMIVHFLNNAFAVLLGYYVAEHPELEPASIEQFEVPWYYVVLGAALFVMILYTMHRWTAGRLAQRTVPDVT